MIQYPHPTTAVETSPTEVSDVARVQAWLDGLTAAGAFPAQEPGYISGQSLQGLHPTALYCWQIDRDASLLWPCEALYYAHRPGVVQVRLIYESMPVPPGADPDRLRATLNRHGLPAFVWPVGRRLVTWGASVLVDIDHLEADLFKPLVRRVETAMRQAIRAING
jgi:hypothetical protein